MDKINLKYPASKIDELLIKIDSQNFNNYLLNTGGILKGRYSLGLNAEISNNSGVRILGHDGLSTTIIGNVGGILNLEAVGLNVRVSNGLSSYRVLTEADKGINIVPLDSYGKISSQYLPSSVDDIVEVTSTNDLNTITGERGKIYVTLDTNITYRWSGTQFVEISKSLGLGTNENEAYPGNLGAANATSINNLTATVGTHSSDISTLKSTVGSHTNTLNNINSTLLSVNQSLTNHGISINTLQTEIGNKASKTEAQGYATTAESNAKTYADNNKLGKTEEAADSAKLGGVPAADYIQKSGGTISNSLASPFVLNNTSTTGEIGMKLTLAGADKGWVGYNNNYGTYLYTKTGPHRLGIKTDGNGYIDDSTILHSRNFHNYVNRFLINGIDSSVKSGSYAGIIQANGADNNPTNGWYNRFKILHGNTNGYYTELAMPFTNTNLYYRVMSNGNLFDWRQIAFTDSNVASATKLATPRTIWGQSFDGTANVNGNLILYNADDLNNGNASSAKLVFGGSSAYRGPYIQGVAGGGWGMKSLVFYQYNTQEWPGDYSKHYAAMTLDIHGRLGIGTTSPSEKLEVAGNIKASGTMTATATYHSSDERLKTFEDDIEVDLEKIKALPKKYFHWTADADGKRQLGTSAQAVEKVFPELVSTNADGYKSVNYANLSIVALAAVDKLAERNAELERRLAKIEKLLNIE